MTGAASDAAAAAAAGIEWIRDGEQVLGMILRREYVPEKTRFLTPDDYKQQVGLIVYAGGGRVLPHSHKPVPRSIVGTSEVILVRRGAADVDFFDDSRRLVARRAVREGDLLLLVAGGHSFSFTKDTILIEIKQGPYVGLDDKERFEP